MDLNMTSFFENGKHILEHPVRWGDMDSFDHVNNTIYFRYFEEARINFFKDMNIKEQMSSQGIGLILATTDCKFIFPITYPDTLTIETVPFTVGTDRFTVKQTIISQQHQCVATISTSTIVAYDHVNKHKATLPESVITLLSSK